MKKLPYQKRKVHPLAHDPKTKQQIKELHAVQVDYKKMWEKLGEALAYARGGALTAEKAWPYQQVVDTMAKLYEDELWKPTAVTACTPLTPEVIKSAVDKAMKAPWIP
jgi:hypothetical protein